MNASFRRMALAAIAGALIQGVPPARAATAREATSRAVAKARAADTAGTARLRRELEALRARVEELERQASAPARSAPAAGGTAAAAADTAASDLEKQLERELGAHGGSTPPDDPASAMASPAPVVSTGAKQFMNFSFDGLFTGGASTAEDVARLETGGHDPNQRGFTIQNVEMVMEGAVDPYFRGQGNVVFQITPDGETHVELEEAYLQTTTLPHNLEFKAGAFFSEFGRLNATHPHTWDFVDQPLVSGRFLGPDGLRGPGARLSWLVPLPFYLEAFVSAQNGRGEIAGSFGGVPGESLFGRPLAERPIERLRDLLYVPRVATSFDLTSTQTVLLGASAAIGPNGAGARTRTRIFGGDLFWKWKASHADAGFPFVKWQGEAMLRRYEADAFTPAPAGPALPAATIEDRGAYSQILWGFRRGWVLGVRGDWLKGADSDLYTADPMGEKRWRVSPNLTWYPTEFSKVRLQVDHDRLAATDDDEESVWLQMEFLLGSHGAHKF